MPFTSLYKKAVLDYTFANTASIPGTGTAGTLYVGLATGGTPDAAGLNVSKPTEVGAGVGYARQKITTATATAGNCHFVDASGTGAIDNASEINFGTASGAGWGTVTSVVVYTTQTGGDYYFYHVLGTAKTVDALDSLKINIGDFDVTLT